MPGEAPEWHDRGIALSREIGAVALVRAHQEINALFSSERLLMSDR